MFLVELINSSETGIYHTSQQLIVITSFKTRFCRARICCFVLIMGNMETECIFITLQQSIVYGNPIKLSPCVGVLYIVVVISSVLVASCNIYSGNQIRLIGSGTNIRLLGNRLVMISLVRYWSWCTWFWRLVFHIHIWQRRIIFLSTISDLTDTLQWSSLATGMRNQGCADNQMRTWILMWTRGRSPHLSTTHIVQNGIVNELETVSWNNTNLVIIGSIDATNDDKIGIIPTLWAQSIILMLYKQYLPTPHYYKHVKNLYNIITLKNNEFF